MTLIEMISSLNAVIQEEDKKIQEAMQAGQLAYKAKVDEMKAQVADDSYLSYELGRFVTNPQSYALPPEAMEAANSSLIMPDNVIPMK